LAGETEVLGESLPQCHFVQHKYHMTLSGIESGLPRWESGTNRQSYDTESVFHSLHNVVPIVPDVDMLFVLKRIYGHKKYTKTTMIIPSTDTCM
jgi:hypothetical protein